jgi:hypothetical protein
LSDSPLCGEIVVLWRLPTRRREVAYDAAKLDIPPATLESKLLVHLYRV